MTIELIREHHVKSPKGGFFQTLGTLRVFDPESGKLIYSCKTLELPWRDNKRYISCIPPAPDAEGEVYEWTLRNPSPSFAYTHIHIKDVKDRTGILVHRGNWVGYTPEESHSLGCILVGKDYAFINKDEYLDVTNSTQAMNELVQLLPQEGKISVRWFLKDGERHDCRMFASQFLQGVNSINPIARLTSPQ
jgi:hypothetical protein